MLKHKIINFLMTTFSAVIFGVAAPFIAIYFYQYNHPEELYFSSTLGATALAIYSLPVGLAFGFLLAFLIRKSLKL